MQRKCARPYLCLSPDELGKLEAEGSSGSNETSLQRAATKPVPALCLCMGLVLSGQSEAATTVFQWPCLSVTVNVISSFIPSVNQTAPRKERWGLCYITVASGCAWVSLSWYPLAWRSYDSGRWKKMPLSKAYFSTFLQQRGRTQIPASCPWGTANKFNQVVPALWWMSGNTQSQMAEAHADVSSPSWSLQLRIWSSCNFIKIFTISQIVQ